MLPIRDNLKPARTPWVTWALLGLNAAVFFYQLELPDWALNRVYRLYGIVPARITVPEWAALVGYRSTGWSTFLTSMFLHGGWLHFLGNMWSLWLFGDDVEGRLGHGRYLAFYLLAGIAAGAGHVALHPHTYVPVIGASGAIAGVMGAYLLLFPHARIEVLVPILIFIDVWSIPAALYLPLWFLTQLFEGTLALAAPGFTGVAFWAHIAGFVAGIVTVVWFVPPADDDADPYRYRAPKGRVRPYRIIRGPGFIIYDR